MIVRVYHKDKGIPDDDMVVRIIKKLRRLKMRVIEVQDDLSYQHRQQSKGITGELANRFGATIITLEPK